MTPRTLRAIELGAAGFRLIRTRGIVLSNGETIILWADGSAGLSGRLFTTGLRVTLEIWTKQCVLAVSRITGAPSCEVETFCRGQWEERLLTLASTLVH